MALKCIIEFFFLQTAIVAGNAILSGCGSKVQAILYDKANPMKKFENLMLSSLQKKIAWVKLHGECTFIWLNLHFF